MSIGMTASFYAGAASVCTREMEKDRRSNTFPVSGPIPLIYCAPTLATSAYFRAANAGVRFLYDELAKRQLVIQLTI